MFNPDNFPESTLIKVNGIELEVYEIGQENAGNPIVLCHGWPEHAFSWRHQIPVLAEAGYHVIVPNQRGYGRSSCPDEVTEYDLEHLAGDLIGLLDHFSYKDAIFMGHDWGATVVWGLTLLHPNRVSKIINLSVPYLERGEKPWIDMLEEFFGGDLHLVHFNRQPGVADAVFDENKDQFLRNLYRKNQTPKEPQSGMPLINLAKELSPSGDLIMSEEELSVFVSAFESTGFTSSLNWYRNINRNWNLLSDVNPIIQQAALMIYGDKDEVAKSENLSQSVPNVEIANLDCGHWIQQEMPEETNRLILKWLKQQSQS